MFLNTFKKLLSPLLNDAGQVVVKTAAATLGVYEQHCRCSTSGAGAYDITLPSSAKNAGLFYYVKFTVKSTNDVTVKGDGATIGVLDTTGDWILVMSTGHEYVVVGGLYT